MGIKDQSEIIKKLRDDNYNLSIENKKLSQDCDKCGENSKIIHEQKKQIEVNKKEEERFKAHIFRRQVKLREMKTILETRDETIADLRDEIDKIASRSKVSEKSSLSLEDNNVISNQKQTTAEDEVKVEKGSNLINEIDK